MAAATVSGLEEEEREDLSAKMVKKPSSTLVFGRQIYCGCFFFGSASVFVTTKKLILISHAY